MAGNDAQSGVWKNPLPAQTSPELEIIYESLSTWLANNVTRSNAPTFTGGITVTGGVLLDSFHDTGNGQIDGNLTVTGSITSTNGPVASPNGVTAAGGHYVPVIPSGGNGWTIQFGSTVITTNASGAGTISFATAFANALSSVVICEGDWSGSSPVELTVVNAGSNGSGFNFNAYFSGAHLASSSVRVNWVAFGF